MFWQLANTVATALNAAMLAIMLWAIAVSGEMAFRPGIGILVFMFVLNIAVTYRAIKDKP